MAGVKIRQSGTNQLGTGVRKNTLAAKERLNIQIGRTPGKLMAVTSRTAEKITDAIKTNPKSLPSIFKELDLLEKKQDIKFVSFFNAGREVSLPMNKFKQICLDIIQKKK